MDFACREIFAFFGGVGGGFRGYVCCARAQGGGCTVRLWGKEVRKLFCLVICDVISVHLSTAAQGGVRRRVHEFGGKGGNKKKSNESKLPSLIKSLALNIFTEGPRSSFFAGRLLWLYEAPGEGVFSADAIRCFIRDRWRYVTDAFYDRSGTSFAKKHF